MVVASGLPTSCPQGRETVVTRVSEAGTRLVWVAI